MLGTGLTVKPATPDTLLPFIVDDMGREWVHVEGGVYSSQFGALTMSPSPTAKAMRYPVSYYDEPSEVLRDIQRRANETGKVIEWHMEIAGIAYPNQEAPDEV